MDNSEIVKTLIEHEARLTKQYKLLNTLIEDYTTRIAALTGEKKYEIYKRIVEEAEAR